MEDNQRGPEDRLRLIDPVCPYLRSRSLGRRFLALRIEWGFLAPKAPKA